MVVSQVLPLTGGPIKWVPARTPCRNQFKYGFPANITLNMFRKNIVGPLYARIEPTSIQFFEFENCKYHMKIKLSCKTEEVKVKNHLLSFHVKAGQVVKENPAKTNEIT